MKAFRATENVNSLKPTKTVQVTLCAGISAPNISVRYFLRVEWIERMGLIWQTGRWAAVFSETRTCIRLFDFFRIRITALWCSYQVLNVRLMMVNYLRRRLL